MFNRLRNQPHIVNEPLCILPLMSNKGWTAIYHWIRPITPLFSLVLMEAAVCSLQLACYCRGVGRFLPGPSPWLLGQRWQGPGLGCSTDWLWLLASVIFVTKCPPAYVVGHDCHNLAEQSSSEQPCCVTLCHLWQQVPNNLNQKALICAAVTLFQGRTCFFIL